MNEWKKRRDFKQPYSVGSLVWWNPDAFSDADLAQLIKEFGTMPFEVYGYVCGEILMASEDNSNRIITSHYSHFMPANAS